MALSTDREDYDSEEEYHFAHWLNGAESAKWIWDCEYHPKTYILAERASVEIPKNLKTKTKFVDKFLFHTHEYTPDFKFKAMCAWVYNFLTPVDAKDETGFVIDVKGSFNKFGDPKQFSINQKWMWWRHGIYVQKIVPCELFLKTWVPEVARYTPKKGDVVKKYLKTPTFEQFKKSIPG